ncbi:MAG: hypothetical protein ACREFX_10640, partial [Opitutaceae bacterium]
TYKPFKNTTIQVNMEIGRDNSNKPFDRPPWDGYSMWWAEGKPTWNSTTKRFSFLGTPQAPFSTTSVYSNPTTFATNNFETSAAGMGSTTYQMSLVYSNPNSSVLGIPGQNFVGYEGQTKDGSGMKGLNGWYGVLNHMIHQNDYTSGYWRIPMMTNPNVFDFYHAQLYGPNAYQWAQWETYNAYLNQTFLDNHAGFRVAYDHQEMDEGAVSPMTYSSYTMMLDINTVLPNGAPNPNFGRPAVASAGFTYVNGIHADNLQGTAFYDFDAREYLHNWLGDAIGDNVLTGSYTRQDTSWEDDQGGSFDTGENYLAAIWGPSNADQTVGGANREVTLLHYLGPSLANAASPADAHTQALTGQWPTNVSTVSILANPSETSGVGTPNPTPSGWTAADYTIQSSGRYDTNNIDRASYTSRTEQEVNSGILIAQNKWFDGNLVTTEGIRRDNLWSYSAGSPPQNSVGVGDLSSPLWTEKLISQETQDSKDWGIVGHSPDFINRYLPWGSTISLSYSYSDNFTATAQRFNIFGDPIGPEIGKTSEYAARFSLFHGKVHLSVGRYRTADALNSSTLGSVQGYINQIPLIIGETFVENATPGGLNAGNTAGLDAWNAWVKTPGAQAFLHTFQFANTDSSTLATWITPNNMVATSDIVSTGWEFEGVLNPTPNWRIALNATESEAVRANTGIPVEDELNGVFIPMLKGAAGTLIDADYMVPIAETFSSNVILPLETITRQDGSPTPELAKWHWNLVTNYAFTTGILKHWNVSGSVRWIADRAIGYPVIDDPVLGAVADVKNPYYTPSRINYDASVGYTIPRIYKDVSWHIQFYVRNIGVGDELIPIHAQPDGSIDTYEIAQPMTWTLANTFRF